MPFRRKSALVPGIDLPGLTMATQRERVHAASQALSGGPRIMLFGCAHGVAVGTMGSTSIATVSLPCIGQLPPAFIDYVLSRDLAEGVLLTGCAEEACVHRFGIAWTEARLAGERDPHLRARVPRERLATCWASRSERTRLERALADLAARLAALDPPAEVRAPARQPELSHG
jgi:coenzyme F420-reducing hydrogenase delta subunit